jgi:hypothetical protein
MEISWKAAWRLYAPYIALLVLNLLGGIYAVGYRNGQREMLHAAADSANEAKTGLKLATKEMPR